MRLGILALFCSAAWASTITADTSCSINYSPVVCGTSMSSAGASAFGGASGIDTTEVLVNLSAFVWVPYAGQASANVSLSFLGNTDGLERPGLATFSIYTDGDHGGGGGAYPQAAIAGLGSCGGYECIRSGTLVPFTLGTPFSVSASIYAGSLSQSGGAAIAQIKLKLFELDGTPVSIFDPPATEVPDPSVFVLVLSGLCIIVIHETIRPFRSTICSTQDRNSTGQVPAWALYSDDCCLLSIGRLCPHAVHSRKPNWMV